MKFVVEWIPAIRNNAEITFSPKYHWHYCSWWWIIRYSVFVVLCSAWFLVQINNFLNLVPFSAVIHKRRGKKLISKIIKYKLDSSSKMIFALFYHKRISVRGRLLDEIPISINYFEYVNVIACNFTIRYYFKFLSF